MSRFLLIVILKRKWKIDRRKTESKREEKKVLKQFQLPERKKKKLIDNSRDGTDDRLKRHRQQRTVDYVKVI